MSDAFRADRSTAAGEAPLYGHHAAQTAASTQVVGLQTLEANCAVAAKGAGRKRIDAKETEVGACVEVVLVGTG